MNRDRVSDRTQLFLPHRPRNSATSSRHVNHSNPDPSNGTTRPLRFSDAKNRHSLILLRIILDNRKRHWTSVAVEVTTRHSTRFGESRALITPLHSIPRGVFIFPACIPVPVQTGEIFPVYTYVFAMFDVAMACD